MFLDYIFLLFCEVQLFAFLAKICGHSEGVGFSYEKLSDIPGLKPCGRKERIVLAKLCRNLKISVAALMTDMGRGKRYNSF